MAQRLAGPNEQSLIPIGKIVVYSIFFLLYLPLLLILVQGMHPKNLLALFQTTAYYRMFLFTLLQATLSTLLALALGLPLAYLLAHFRFPLRALIRALCLVPFVLPAILLVLGCILVWGNNGIINRMMAGLGLGRIPFLYSFFAIVMAHALYNFGICTRIVSDRWATLSTAQLRAAKNLGAGRLQIYRDIVLPHLRPAIQSSCTIVFLLCFTSFAVVLVLGGGPWHSTLELAIYRLVRMENAMQQAASLALIQLCTTLMVCLLYFRNSTETSAQFRSERKALGMKQAWSLPYLLFLFCVSILPLLAIVTFSFGLQETRMGATTMGLRSMSMLPLRAFSNSMMLALGAMSCSLLLGATISMLLRRLRPQLASLLQLVSFLPYCISPIILSLGYMHVGLWFGRQSLVLLMLVHAVYAMPLVLRILFLSMTSVQQKLCLAAANLGASPAAIRKTIYLPLMLPGILVAASLAICISLGELSAALMLAPSDKITLPLAIYQLIGRYRLLDASRQGLLLILLSFILLGTIDLVLQRFSRRMNNAGML